MTAMTTLTAEDRRLLGENIERFAARGSGDVKRGARSCDEDRRSRSVWTELADLGLLGLGLPERLGGIGGSIMDLAIRHALQQLATKIPVFLDNGPEETPCFEFVAAKECSG